MTNKTIANSFKGGQQGFTLVEILVVVIIIGILAAIGLPLYMGAQNKARIACVKVNMHVTQVAAESYATDTSGVYPPDVPTMASYYPGGDSTVGGVAGVYPVNPVTGVQNDTPYAATPATMADVMALRALSGTQAAGGGTKGQNGYSQVDQGETYAITGNDPNNNYVPGLRNHVMVLSNQ